VVEMEHSVSLLGAFLGEKLIAAILIFQDKQEWFYWHGVRDPEYDKYFAMDVLFYYVIQKSYKHNSNYFNMGGSRGLESLEFFKERWGAEKKTVWQLHWRNPLWHKILQI
jgi:lipid II:glycine glycyltransferase (peptidoglycan interpeptide bridge formation enzyme)